MDVSDILVTIGTNVFLVQVAQVGSVLSDVALIPDLRTAASPALSWESRIHKDTKELTYGTTR